MAKQSKTSKQPVREVFFIITSVLSVVMFALAAMAWWGGSFATNMVRDELGAQNIYFPEKGSPALDPAKYPDLQKYAGQKVDTYAEAKAYANGYIGRHLEDIADGKSYAEVSTLQRANPDDAALAGQKQALFQGETLRGILLTSGYAFGLIGTIALIAAGVLAALGVALALTAFYLATRKR